MALVLVRSKIWQNLCIGRNLVNYVKTMNEGPSNSDEQAEDSVLFLQPDRALCSHLLDGAARLHAAARFGGEAHLG